MLARLENLIYHYTSRLTRDSQTALSALKMEWPDIAEHHGFNVKSVFPITYKNHTLTLESSSLEEAARLRLLTRSILISINKKIPSYNIKDIKFVTKHHERTQ